MVDLNVAVVWATFLQILELDNNQIYHDPIYIYLVAQPEVYADEGHVTLHHAFKVKCKNKRTEMIIIIIIRDNIIREVISYFMQ